MKAEMRSQKYDNTQSCSMAQTKRACYLVLPENLEVSTGVAGVSKDWAFFNIRDRHTCSNIRGASLEPSTARLKMGFIVKFYITSFQNFKVSSKINPSYNFGM